MKRSNQNKIIVNNLFGPNIQKVISLLQIIMKKIKSYKIMKKKKTQMKSQITKNKRLIKKK